MATVNKAELAIELGRAMQEMRNKSRQTIQLRMKENNMNLTFEMLEVLSCLWRKNGINQQEIADITLKDKSSMTYLIDNLVKRNMVKRVEDENDRRNKLIYLTDEANNLKAQLYPWVTEMYTVATEDIDADDLTTCLNLINKMVGNLP
ncbi:MarR family winged helix-turn-helix transcriptional regulator [Mucilaginibacter jinjuensis]|uniref:MarR family transcriptional regulator n=1 Tax=Mucilaginibacter jinjuensis TaxID=1176721 RepID=A0ABY7TE87_9SPHI|nr:MarR family transcriptional regulator [Mucilaginibacter jinjuensis]WCT14554.1 MarR family transcriptional regulator [Mucilaginibacter jinjuensis]